jgi:pimeloyl-ACP methyl ester carboxylesterase
MSSSNIPLIDSTIQLRDGRTLGYMEVGKADGLPIFHFHGNGSSRLEVLIVQSAAENLGVRLIGLDRPGIGRSDRPAGYQLLDWPDDVAEVADQLGIERFAVEGLSGGAPYALACAYKIQPRLTGCSLISSAIPGSFIGKADPLRLRAALWTLEHLPWLIRFFVRLSMRLTGSDEASIEKTLVRAGARLGAADHKLLGIPEIRRSFVQAIAESFRQGADENTKDAMIFTQPGFQVGEITFEKIFLWHGEQDRVMPVAPARRLAQALPHCTATFYPDEGHLSTFVNHARDIWKALSL